MANEGLMLRGITKSFGSFHALDDINVHIPKGKFTCLLGPSGCGKTTLLRIISGLEQANRGQVLLDGEDISSLSAAKRNFGIVFQSYALFPNLSVRENIGYGLKGKLKRGEIQEKIDEMLELVGLGELGRRYPAQLSGGQQQRVALARAVAMSPKVLLLDEPLSALDARVRAKLREQLCELQERLGITTVMVTHDQEEALTMADDIVVMDHGRVVQTGTPQVVYEAPNSPFVADFIGAVNFLPAGYVDGKDGLHAVRPEHIEMLVGETGEAYEADAKSGYVQHVEFRGAYCRISLKLTDLRGAVTDSVVTIDLPSEKAANIPLAKSSLVKFRITPDRLLYYPDQAASL
ncbi:ATP-binding cassette domain-containing protein [Paenibacillus sp. LHD-117]|uniref:ABC transporter ATP-binding protein n=1 Tax=Paenibacillus sp. LHD-117 TaxID=3071412 RepID=UPI0027E02666|nr:ATP-binding cassette domain-containing protein [Paenibacillus sp. LHD-117]MDQ6420656.1 ATP-binding cassette domain-containing protein [Paenibacillus sp. LHD-117]